jgi:hypothetical protein
VVHAGVDERLFDPLAIDRGGGVVGVFLDDREQVTEQLALERRQLGPVDQRPRGGIADAVDLQAEPDQRRRGRGQRVGYLIGRLDRARARVAAPDGPAQPLGGRFALLRNRLPSSYRCA